jgi:copper transport protein
VAGVGRLAVAAAAGLAALLLLPARAEAHALLVRSDPAAGSSLARVPGAVDLTFSEAPDAAASTVQVLDTSGAAVSRGPARAAPGSPFRLTVALAPLLNGVYTVRWKTVSADDGHASSGSFTFGVGPSAYAASAGPAPALAVVSTSASPLVVAGRWVFYAGLGLLAGGAWIALLALPGAGRRVLLVTLAGALAGLGGLAASGAGQAAAAGISPAELPSTSLGLALLWQALPVLAAAACVEAALLWRGRRRSAALALATLLAAAAVVAHVLTTHAAASRTAWLAVAAQSAHLGAFAAWVGGLAALLVAVGSRPSPARALAVRRFSQVAAVSLVVVAGTGLLRAVDEVAGWTALAGTLFGRLVALKVVLLLALAGLGGWNRLRSVPAAHRSLGGLRRVGSVELVVAGVVLLASATLTSLVPPALVAAEARQPAPPRLVARGGAGAARATLEVTPGYPGRNRFTLRGDGPAARRALAGDVTLRFAMPTRPELPAAALPLARAADGAYGGEGDGLSLIGDWDVAAEVRRGGAVVELPFRVTCVPSPQQLRQMTMGGAPMVHGLRLANGWRLQAYLAPERAGRSTLHLVFTDARGGPVDVPASPAVTAVRGGVSRRLVAQRLGAGAALPNHFYAVDSLEPGRWEFRVTVGAAGGGAEARFTLPVT